MSARISQVLYGHKHCLLPIKNSHNQPQQVKAGTAQKVWCLLYKVRLLRDIFV
ncbi:hypothetical protein QUB13_08455 [Microcoleus sp. B4-D4]